MTPLHIVAVLFFIVVALGFIYVMWTLMQPDERTPVGRDRRDALTDIDMMANFRGFNNGAWTPAYRPTYPPRRTRETDQQYRDRLVRNMQPYNTLTPGEVRALMAMPPYTETVRIQRTGETFTTAQVRDLYEQSQYYIDPQFLEMKQGKTSNLQEIKHLDPQNYDID